MNILILKMSTTKFKINDLPQRLKIARNHAVLGNYQEALIHYSTSISLIEYRINEITDNFLKDKWIIVSAEVKSEISHCGALLKLCKSFKTNPFDNNKNQENKQILKNEMNLNNEEIKKEFSNNSKEINISNVVNNSLNSDNPKINKNVNIGNINPFAENLNQDKKNKKEFKPERFDGKEPFSHIDDKSDKQKDFGDGKALKNYIDSDKNKVNLIYPPNNPSIFENRNRELKKYEFTK